MPRAHLSDSVRSIVRRQAKMFAACEPLELRRLLSSAPLAVFTDVNSDGMADLIMASKKAGDGAAGAHITIQIGNADGTFASPTIQDLSAAPIAIAAGDVNGDGVADILVASKAHGGSSIRVFLTAAGPTFTSVDSTVPLKGPAFVIGDVTGDNKADLVSFGKNAAAIAPGNGDGTFDTTATTPSATLEGDFGPGPALADINGDSNADLVGFGRDGLLHAAPGSVDVSFSPAIAIDIGLAGQKVARNKFSVAISDVDGDSVNDIVLLPAKRGVPVFVAYGNGDGTFATATEAFLNAPSVLPDYVGPGYSTNGQFTLMAANIDSGGAADLVGLERKPTPADPVALVAFDNGKGFGHPVLATTFAGKLDPTTPALSGDINSDGKDDLIYFTPGSGGRGTVSVQINLGKGAFGNPTVSSLPAGTFFKNGLVKLGDFNGDSKLDAIVIDKPGKTATTLNTRVLLGNGDGTFAAPTARPITSLLPYLEQFSGGIFVADVSGDGKDDLLFLPRPGVVSSDQYLVSVTDGASNNAVATLEDNLFPSDTLISGYAVGDINGDQVVDLVAFKAAAGGAMPVSIAFGDGSVRFADGSVRFAAPTTFSFHPGGVNLTSSAKPLLSDVNGDGRLDLVVIMQNTNKQVTSATTSPAFVSLANADGTFADPVQASRFASPAGELPLAADIDGDGRTDLLSVSNVTSKSLHVITFTLAKSDGTFGARVPAT